MRNKKTRYREDEDYYVEKATILKSVNLNNGIGPKATTLIKTKLIHKCFF